MLRLLGQVDLAWLDVLLLKTAFVGDFWDLCGFTFGRQTHHVHDSFDVEVPLPHFFRVIKDGRSWLLEISTALKIGGGARRVLVRRGFRTQAKQIVQAPSGS